MTVYYGTVKGKTIVLGEDAKLDEGSMVEVRPLGTEQVRQLEEDDLRVQRALLEAGLIAEIRPLGARPPEAELPPIQVEGTPLSEVIIAERR